MSWGFSLKTRTSIEAFDSAFGGAADLYRSQGATPLASEAEEQVEAARQAARNIIESGVVGDDTTNISVSFSGHANPGHAPQPGWANDFVQVTITQGQ